MDAYEYARGRLLTQARSEAESPPPDERLRPALVRAVTQCLDLDMAIGDWFQTLRLSLEDLAAQPVRRDDETLARIYGDQDVVSWRSEHAHAVSSPSLNRRLMLREDTRRCASAARIGRFGQKRWAAMKANATAAEVRRILNRFYTFGLGNLARWERSLHGSSFFLSALLNRQVSQCMASYYPALALAWPWVDPAIRMPHATPFGAVPSMALHQLHSPLADLTPVPGPARTPRRVVTLRQALREVSQMSPGLGHGPVRPRPRSVGRPAAREPEESKSSGSSEEDGGAAEARQEGRVPGEEETWPPPALATGGRAAARPRARRVPVRLRMARRAPPPSGPPSPRPDLPRPSVPPALLGSGAPPAAAPVDGCSEAGQAPRVRLRARSLATLVEMLAPGYPAPVTVQAYLQLLEDFIATNMRCGYLRRVTHLSGQRATTSGPRAQDVVRLCLGVGESLSFTRFDGLRCVMGFHYPHDRDGHQHRRVPKEYRTQYLRVFSVFGIGLETVVADDQRQGPGAAVERRADLDLRTPFEVSRGPDSCRA